MTAAKVAATAGVTVAALLAVAAGALVFGLARLAAGVDKAAGDED